MILPLKINQASLNIWVTLQFVKHFSHVIISNLNASRYNSVIQVVRTGKTNKKVLTSNPAPMSLPYIHSPCLGEMLAIQLGSKGQALHFKCSPYSICTKTWTDMHRTWGLQVKHASNLLPAVIPGEIGYADPHPLRSYWQDLSHYIHCHPHQPFSKF